MSRSRSSPPTSGRWALWITAGGFFLVQVVVLRGAASPFRLPKEAAALAALSLALGLAAASAAHRRRASRPTGQLPPVLAALPLLMAVSASWATHPLRALQSAAAAAVWVAAILWMATLAREDRRLLTAAAAAGVACSVGVLVLQIAGVPVFDFGPETTGRMQLTGLTGNPADLAMACVLLLPLLLTQFEGGRRRSHWYVLTAVLAGAAVVTQTLTGIAGLTLLTVVWLVQTRSRRAAVTAAALALVIAAAAAATGIGQRLVTQAERLTRGDWYLLLSARADGWTAASEMIRQRPVVGVGAANYTVEYYPSRLRWLVRNEGTGGRNELASHFQWAHCDPLQLAAELGAPGAVWAAVTAWALFATRRRAGPLLPLAAAAWLPFALLHYPGHLAVGLVPTSIALAAILADAGPRVDMVWRRGRLSAVAAIAVLAAASVSWQMRRVAVDVWMGSSGLRLQALQAAPRDARLRGAAGIEAEIAPRIGGLPLQAAELWRMVGRTRLLRNDPDGAAAAFRRAHALWPHEDSELYLGLSLAARGRRGEALQHLGRVCRTNPALASLIGDADLRRTVEDMLAAYRR